MFVLALLLAVFAAPPITITTRDYFSNAPGTVRVRIEIEPYAGNISWCLFYDGGMAGESCYQIDDGLKAPRIYQRVLKDLPAGEYEAVAVVYRNDTDQKVGRVRFRVLGRGQEPSDFEPQ